MPAGRPTIYSEEIVSAILERLSDGESLNSICLSEDLPHRATVFRWLTSNEAFRDQYVRAREGQADALFDDLLTIADDGRNDWMERFGKDGASLGWFENGEALRRSALRIDARKWMASKLLPKKYGDKVVTEVTGKDGGPIETAMSITEEARHVAFLLAKAARQIA